MSEQSYLDAYLIPSYGYIDRHMMCDRYLSLNDTSVIAHECSLTISRPIEPLAPLLPTQIFDPSRLGNVPHQNSQVVAVILALHL